MPGTYVGAVAEFDYDYTGGHAGHVIAQITSEDDEAIFSNVSCDTKNGIWREFFGYSKERISNRSPEPAVLPVGPFNPR